LRCVNVILIKLQRSVLINRRSSDEIWLRNGPFQAFGGARLDCWARPFLVVNPRLNQVCLTLGEAVRLPKINWNEVSMLAQSMRTKYRRPISLIRVITYRHPITIPSQSHQLNLQPHPSKITRRTRSPQPIAAQDAASLNHLAFPKNRRAKKFPSRIPIFVTTQQLCINQFALLSTHTLLHTLIPRSGPLSTSDTTNGRH